MMAPSFYVLCALLVAFSSRAAPTLARWVDTSPRPSDPAQADPHYYEVIGIAVGTRDQPSDMSATIIRGIPMERAHAHPG